MTLRSFIDAASDPEYTIAVISESDEAGPLTGLLEEALETQSIDVRSTAEGDDPAAVAAEVAETIDAEGDVAVLLENGAPVATTPMRDLYESILAINSDLFVTGARGLGEIELPEVLAKLAETRLQLRGYPLAHKEKLLLILVSRYIEQQAWNAGAGTLRTAFQRLSRLDDELGTRDVYTELAASGVDVHVYGIDDGPTVDLDADVHTGTDRAYRDGWFVVYRPDDAETNGEASALVCLETEPRVWEGFWTRNPDRVAAIDAAIARDL